MLTDSDHEVRWRAIHGLRWTPWRQPYRTPRIIKQMFELLSNRETGSTAASYLRAAGDEKTAKEAEDRLNASGDLNERINLCAIINKRKPEVCKKILFAALDDYDSSYHNALYYALGSLGKEYIIPEILVYLKTDEAELRLTVLEALRAAVSLHEQLSIGKEDCENLMVIWETCDPYQSHIAGYLLVDHCSSVSKYWCINHIICEPEFYRIHWKRSGFRDIFN